MSAVEQPRQRRGVHHWAALLMRAALGLVLTVVLVAVLAVAGLSWRLAQGPLDVTWLVAWLEPAVLPADAPSRLTVGSASVAWNGFATGADSGLELRMRDLAVVDHTGRPGALLAQADVVLALAPLVALRVTPRSIVLSGLRLRAVRGTDGTVRPDVGALPTDTTATDEAPSLDDVLAELRAPAGGRSHIRPSLDALTDLRHVRVVDATLELLDQGSSASYRGSLAELDLRRMSGGGVTGAASGQVGIGSATATLDLKAALVPDGGTHFEIAMAPVATGAIAGAIPGAMSGANTALASLGALDAAIDAHGSLDLAPDLAPRAATLQVSSGAGRLTLPSSTQAFSKLGLAVSAHWVDASWQPSQVTLERAEAVLLAASGKPTDLVVTGAATRHGTTIDAQADVMLDQVAFADLPSIWPQAWGGNVRPWLVTNVTAGVAHDGAIHLVFTAPANDLGNVDLTDASGTLLADNTSIHWLRPVPPIEHAQARLRVAGPDVIEIAIPTATQGPLAVKDSSLRFTGLAGHDQFMALTANISGGVPDMLTLLRHPRLRLLDKHPLPIKSSAGTVAAKLSVDMPLVKELTMDQVKIDARGQLGGLKLAGLVAGRDLERGDIGFGVTQDGLKAAGTANVAGIAGTIAVDMDFRSGPPDQVLQRASVNGRATLAQLVATGADPGGLITSGSANVSATYATLRSGSGTVEVKADLANAGLALVGWTKPPGPAASAGATILLQNDKLAGVDHLRAEGPGMEVAASAEMIGGRPLLLHLDRFVLGPTRVMGDVRFPERKGEPIRAQLSGPELDISTELGLKPGRNNGENEPAWIADIRFGRVVLPKGKALIGVVAHAEHDGRRLKVLQATSTGPERLQASISPQGTGRKLSVRAADAGAVLEMLSVTTTVQGGALALDADYDDRYADPPLSGTVDVTNFDVHDAVILGKLLQAVTIYGIVDALSSNGVRFTRLVLPFRYEQNVLRIGESRAYSASLGLTAQGWVDLNRQVLDLHGTIVPAYVLNSALGRIPLVGRLFSPETGGGLVAVNYGVTGKTADPSVSVNPLSALTPGFLRGLFNIFS